MLDKGMACIMILEQPCWRFVILNFSKHKQIKFILDEVIIALLALYVSQIKKDCYLVLFVSNGSTNLTGAPVYIVSSWSYSFQ